MPDVTSWGQPSAAELASAVGAVLTPVFEHLDVLSGLVLDCWREAGGVIREEDLAPVAEHVTALLPADPLLEGHGYVADIGLVRNTESHFMMWWQMRGARATRLRLNSELASLDLYDYARMEWFTTARDERRRVIVGPYVDYSGSELFATTVTVPIFDGDRFLGIAGADLHFRDLARRLLGQLRKSTAHVCVVDSDRRVIAVNSARWLVAERLKRLPVAGEAEIAEVADVPGGFGWQVAVAVTDG